MEPQSCFMFLSICNEILGLKPEETLESDFVLLVSILKERNYTLNERNRLVSGEIDNKEYKEIVDINTGKIRKVEKVKSI